MPIQADSRSPWIGVELDGVGNRYEISVSEIARRAGVDRSFLYRHNDLLEQIHATEAQPPNAASVGAAVSRASLQADLLNAQQRASRLAARVQQLENRLSEALGEQAWHESGLGAPDDIDGLKQRIVTLEQHTVELRLQLEERDQDLVAARAANRELRAQLNAHGTPHEPRPTCMHHTCRETQPSTTAR